MTYILGLSAYYHDSAAALLHDGEIIAAAQEERFTRIRHDPAFPENSIQFCIRQAGISISDIDHIVFYDKPLLKFERLLETHLATVPTGLPAFIKAMPVWLKEKLYLKKVLREELSAIGECEVADIPGLLFSSHHQAHAASAYYASPFEKAAVLCLDGVGEWATTTAWLAEGKELSPLWQINFPHSLGLLYSAFTYYTGFRVNSGEYKLMGLAPYGEAKYVDLILDNLIDVKQDGSFRLDMSFFNFASGLTMTSKKFHDLFGGDPRKPESDIRQRDMDIASSIQVVTENIVLRLAKKLQLETGVENLCLAGGVALNCVANGRLQDEGLFNNIWVQPAAGDAGGALGAAYLVWHQYLNNHKEVSQQDRMQGALLGTQYSDSEIENVLSSAGAHYKKYETDDLLSVVSGYLNDRKVVGWFQGKMEFGPRALGSRSILGDPRSEDMQSVINLKIKNRESFRPFAPAVLLDKLSDWFEMSVKSPYMLFVTHLKKDKCLDVDQDEKIQGLDKLKIIRSQVPSVTHVDKTARVQSVSLESNPMFYRLLSKFYDLTKCPILINTSFNVRGEPIVESPDDALTCFMTTGMDVLAIGSFVLLKNDQPDNLLDTLDHRKPDGKQHASAIELPPKHLRQFAVSTGVAVSLVFGWFFPWLADLKPDINIMIFSTLWILWGLLFPMTLRSIYKGWMLFGSMMGRFMTPLILSIIYITLIIPAGLIMRVLGNDPLCRKLDSSVDSYCLKSERIEPSDLEKPF
jgi:carbamoyltransferase